MKIFIPVQEEGRNATTVIRPVETDSIITIGAWEFEEENGPRYRGYLVINEGEGPERVEVNLEHEFGNRYNTRVYRGLLQHIRSRDDLSRHFHGTGQQLFPLSPEGDPIRSRSQVVVDLNVVTRYESRDWNGHRMWFVVAGDTEVAAFEDANQDHMLGAIREALPETDGG